MKYLSLDDFARLEYGRLFWKSPRAHRRLLAHWMDRRHPHRDRFLVHRDLIEAMLSLPVEQLDAAAKSHGSSVRAAIREIPPVFGQFWADSAATPTIEWE